MLTPKFNQEVYVVLPTFEGFDLVKGRVVGCFENDDVRGKYLFAIDTITGHRVFRGASCIWGSVEDFKDSVKDFVID